MDIRALIVEDEPDLQWIFSEAFAYSGFEVTIAKDGCQALEFLRDSVPHVVVLDLHMPKCSGDEVLEHMRQSGQLNQIYVIVVTGDALAGRFLDRHLVDLVLIKPVDPVALVVLAKRVAKSGRKQNALPAMSKIDPREEVVSDE